MLQVVLLLTIGVPSTVLSSTLHTNCSAIPIPTDSANIFMPPATCSSNDSHVAMCMNYYHACITRASSCSRVNRCFKGQMACLIAITPSASQCDHWSASLSNAGLYIAAGGLYEGTSVEQACEYGLCQGLKKSLELNYYHRRYFPSCAADFGSICNATPAFESPTRPSSQPEYTVTFSSSGWPAVMSDAPKDSAKYNDIEAALMKGFGRSLGIPEWFLVTITDLTSASSELIVKFFPDPADFIKSKAPSDMMTKLRGLINNNHTSRHMFNDLHNLTGISPFVTNVSVDG